MVPVSGRGLPRPIAEDGGVLRPVPWSQGDDWGEAHDARQRIAQQQSRCLVCGEVVQEGVVLVRTDKSDLISSAVPIRDAYDINDLPYKAEETRVVEGAMHGGCAKITRCHCKTVRERLHDKIWVERPYKRGRYKRGHLPVIPYR